MDVWMEIEIQLCQTHKFEVRLNSKRGIGKIIENYRVLVVRSVC